jgi:hypothetical protein
LRTVGHASVCQVSALFSGLTVVGAVIVNGPQTVIVAER